MKKFIALFILISNAIAFADGSSFSEVWRQVKSDSYALPHNVVTLTSFFGLFENKLKTSAIRTINNRADLLPRFNKLVHPNGICLAGSWTITEDNPYTGFFAKGARGLIISRASVALSDTNRGAYRGFGFAGKIYPTTDELERTTKTANFFVVDDLGGTLTPNYTEAVMTNHPEATMRFSIMAIAAAAVKAFGDADKNPMIRQVYEIAELGLAPTAVSKTPEYFMIKAAPGQRAEAKDFRNELRLNLALRRLVFDINVAASKEAAWSRIGRIEFSDSVVSDSCDHRLHFPHPKWQ